jgi:putative tryptophan/tyrosine transport system substrate-binding protein
MRRREFFAGLGAMAWSSVARAQQVQRTRRIGVITGRAADDRDASTFMAAFAQALQEHGWTVGDNVRIDYRWGASDADLRRKFATELVGLQPDILLATAESIVVALQQASRTVPIVFVEAIDPVGGGVVETLSRPGGNATGFASYEFSIGGKWLELLKEIAPSVTRVAVIRDATVPAGAGGFAAIQTVAPSFQVELTPIGVRDPGEIERGIISFARGSKGGLIMVGPGASVLPYRDFIVTLAARYRLPAVYSNSSFVARGGLISYTINYIDQYRLAAGYVDRILRGERPADLNGVV